MEEKLHRRAIRAWTLYDWANSAFATTIMAAVLPVYYSTVAAEGLPKNLATAYWGYTTSISALLAAILSPVLGALADFTAAKKKFLTGFMVLGVTGTALLYFVQTGDYLLASLFFLFGNIGFAGSLVYYDALLPHVARPQEIDQVSSRGYAMGYIGGGLLLAINLVMILFVPEWLPGADEGLMTRLSFVTVAVWWFAFTLPLLRHVREPARRIELDEVQSSPLRASIARLVKTFREMRRYDQLFWMLLTFWVYSNGIGTIITMATIYGAEIGIGQTALIGTLLMVQFLGAPFAFLFGWLARKIGPKPAIYLSLSVYCLIAVLGYFLQYEWHFWVLGGLVATVQGGSQALSRSLIGRMMPKSKSAEFYGFFSVFEKFSSIAGPFLFALVAQVMGQSRLSIVSLVVFFVAGMVMLRRVDVQKGVRAAEEEEARLVQA